MPPVRYNIYSLTYDTNTNVVMAIFPSERHTTHCTLNRSPHKEDTIQNRWRQSPNQIQSTVLKVPIHTLCRRSGEGG